MSSDPKGLEGSRPNGGLGRCSAFVGVCPDVGKASVVLHAVANRTHRPVLDRLVGCALIEIPVDRNHPDPAFRGTAFPAFWAHILGRSCPAVARAKGERSVVLLSKLKLEVLVFGALFCAFKRTRETQKS